MYTVRCAELVPKIEAYLFDTDLMSVAAEVEEDIVCFDTSFDA